eukprot:3136996-Rhodomonas_salina.1
MKKTQTTKTLCAQQQERLPRLCSFAVRQWTASPVPPNHVRTGQLIPHASNDRTAYLCEDFELAPEPLASLGPHWLIVLSVTGEEGFEHAGEVRDVLTVPLQRFSRGEGIDM